MSHFLPGTKPNTAHLYLAAYSNIDQEFLLEVPIESAICLFILKWLNYPFNILVTLVLHPKNQEKSLLIRLDELESRNYREFTEDNLSRPVSDCHLPVFTSSDGFKCVAGLCAVLRQVVKCCDETYKKLLGFREGCLAACAEVSLWTKFCEVDLVRTIEQLLKKRLLQKCSSADDPEDSEDAVPLDVCRFEEHMKQSVRVHNYMKIRQETNQDSIEHSFAECNQMTLADLIILPCFHVISSIIGFSVVKNVAPSVMKWYDLVCSQNISWIKGWKKTEACLFMFQIEKTSLDYLKLFVPKVPAQSLYKSDPKRYRPRSKLFTKQEEVKSVLEAIDQLTLSMQHSLRPFGHEQSVDWHLLPHEVKPTVPDDRLKRKTHQLENLSKAVLEVAKPGDIIVDFCSGSGHLGILVAYLMPDCNIVLLDNKEESLSYAHKRVADLKLKNITIIQCNLDYFKGDFQVGMSLHACGVASDLVIQTCLQKRAAFIVCPCCYGSLQNNHKIDYPQSRCLKESTISERDFFVISHCADQTHKQVYKKSEQGERCMSIVDYDRCLQAKDAGYSVSISKLTPSDCTPKNNLLVGIPP